ncbi:MAG: tetratricopeptide repeat protein [Candidatus Omnitrophota bacterium]
MEKPLGGQGRDDKKFIHVDLPEIDFPARKNQPPSKEAEQPKDTPSVSAHEAISAKNSGIPLRQGSPAGLIATLLLVAALLILSAGANLYLVYNASELKAKLESGESVAKDIVLEKEAIRKAKDSLEKENDQLTSRVSSLMAQSDELRESMKSNIEELLSAKENGLELNDKLEEYDKESAKLRGTSDRYRGALEKEKENSAKLARIIREQEEELESAKRKPASVNQAGALYEAAHYYELGYLYAKAGMFEKAIENFKKFITVNGENAEAYYNIAYIYERSLNDTDSAVEYYDKYIALSPGSEDVYLVKNRVESLRRAGAKPVSAGSFKIDLDRLKY